MERYTFSPLNVFNSYISLLQLTLIPSLIPRLLGMRDREWGCLVPCTILRPKLQTLNLDSAQLSHHTMKERLEPCWFISPIYLPCMVHTHTQQSVEAVTTSPLLSAMSMEMTLLRWACQDAQRYMYSLYHLAVSNHHLYVSSGGSREQLRVLFISVESSGGLQVPLALLMLRTVCIPHAQQLPTVDVPKVYPASSTTHHQCCSVLVLGTWPETHTQRQFTSGCSAVCGWGWPNLKFYVAWTRLVIWP